MAAQACFSENHASLDLRVFTPVKSSIIKLDKKLNLAENPISLHRQWIAEGGAKKTLTDLLVGYVKKHLRKEKFQYKKYWLAVNMIIANGFYSYKINGQVLYSRSTSHKKNDLKNPDNITNTTVKNVVDVLTHYGYLIGEKGHANEYQKFKSWFECSEKLVSIFINAQILIRESRKTPEIQLRDKNKKPKGISKHNKDVRLAKKLKRPVSEFNTLWLEHEATVNGAPIIPYLHRIFNIRLEWGGRFYGIYQTMEKTKRKQILIDGKPTVELDYSGLHINLLYAEIGIQLFDDAYERIGLLDASLSKEGNRSLLKLLMLKFVNSENIGAFKANITTSGKPETKKKYQEYLKVAPFFTEKELKKKFPDMEWFIENVPDNLQGETVVNMIVGAHPEIKHLFNEERIGSKLQFKDSEIMAACLTKLLKFKVAALPIHDSLICARDYEYLVSNAMLEAYSEHTNGLKITIK
jgi:hypothetical protein